MTDMAAARLGGVVRFGVLGPLQVVDGSGAPRVVSAAKQRIVLATLLLASGGTVSAASLSEALWDATPPPNASAVMRTYVARLRRALGPAGVRVAGQPSGWAVHLRGTEELDLAEVDRLWRAGRAARERGEWRQVSSLLARASGLWRGEPLVDVPSSALARRETGRLAELRLRLFEDRIDADLRLGLNGELVAELRRLTAEYPLREHLRMQLMLACYRSGHQAAALEVYRDARATLADELGVDPGRELHELHQKILTRDPDLNAGAWALVSVPEPAAEDMRQPLVEAAMPRQLPASMPHFTGRAAELARLTELAWATAAASIAPILVISGMAGIGKTALAVHWAHQAAEDYPDGQLYVNLRGYGPSGVPAEPAQVVRGFLEALGVRKEATPSALDAQVGLYRSLLAGSRTLIVLDNARDEAHVRSLLPGSADCLVIVTSRSQLAGLAAVDGAQLLTLDVLADADAEDLLSARLGQRRVAAEPAAVAEIASSCGRLPLALAIAAARACARPAHPLASVAAELREADGPLDALDAGEPAASVRAVFSWSYRQLSREAARMFRLQGVHPGPDITAPAAASLAGRGRPEARRLLTELTRAHLLAEHVPGRYACHDLLRAYATELSHSTDNHTRRSAAAHRMLDHYQHTTRAAALLLNPSREPITLSPARPGVRPESLDSKQRALAWLEAEHQVLISAVSLATRDGFDTYAWKLPWAMSNFLDWQGHWHEWAAIEHIALAAATRLGDLAGQAKALRALASAYARLGDYDQARDHLDDCLELCRQSGDRSDQARAQQTLSWLFGEEGRYAEALGHAEQALALFQAIDNPSGQASTLNNAGWYHIMLGEPQLARTLCQQALVLHRKLGEHHGQASSWDSLGHAEQDLGNLAEAAKCYNRALGLYRQLGNRHFEADSLIRLGDTRHADGNNKAARDAWRQALAILDDLNHSDASLVRGKLYSCRPAKQPESSTVSACQA